MSHIINLYVLITPKKAACVSSNKPEGDSRHLLVVTSSKAPPLY